MAFDYKKEYKEFYLPKSKPGLVTVPAMNFVAVRGKGDPNEEGGDYKTAMGLLYGLAFTIKMSKPKVVLLVRSIIHSSKTQRLSIQAFISNMELICCIKSKRCIGTNSKRYSPA